MNKMKPTHDNDALFSQIKTILDEARKKISRTVNSAMVQAYWNVGKYIVEYEQKGEQRAEYGKNSINDLSTRLVKEYGNGFTATNLRYMRQFYLSFPIYHTLCDKLSWSHCRTLVKVQSEKARMFYLNECIGENWSVRQLERQINTLFYERLLASNDKETVRNEIKQKEPIPLEPREIIRDPYILEFIGIPQGEHFLESDLGQMQMYVNYYTRELMNPGDNQPVGIVLCADKNEAVVKYTLPEDNKQIFASQYMTYLPSEEELKQLIQQLCPEGIRLPKLGKFDHFKPIEFDGFRKQFNYGEIATINNLKLTTYN